MFRNSQAIISLIIISLAATVPAFAAETTSTNTQPSIAKPATKTAPAAKPAPKTAVAKPKKSAVTRTIDTQLSGFTSQDADSIYARLSMDEKRNGRNWYARGSVTRTATHVNRTSHVLTYKLDSRHEKMRNDDEYNVFNGVVSTRDRGSSVKVRESGYQLVSYGIGKQWDVKTKGEIGLGLVNVRDEDTGVRPCMVAGLQGSRPLSRKLTLNTDLLAIQPVEDMRSTKLDSEIGLSYQVTPEFYVRLNWQATNLIRSAYTYKEWDSVVRLSISFRQTTTSD